MKTTQSIDLVVVANICNKVAPMWGLHWDYGYDEELGYERVIIQEDKSDDWHIEITRGKETIEGLSPELDEVVDCYRADYVPDEDSPCIGKDTDPYEIVFRVMKRCVFNKLKDSIYKVKFPGIEKL